MRLERIKVLVEEAYGFPIAAKNRKRNVVYARKVFCKIGREFGYKWQDIADHVGYPKHDLAIYAFKTFHAIEEYDMKLYERIVETIECYILEQNKQSEIERYNKMLQADKETLVFGFEAKNALYRSEIRQLKEKNEGLERQLNGGLEFSKLTCLWTDEERENFIQTRLVPFGKALESRRFN